MYWWDNPFASEFTYDPNNESGLIKELVLQVRKVIGPFAAPKKIFIIGDLPKTRSGKIMRRIMRKIVAGEGDQLGDLSTLADPSVVDLIKKKVAESAWGSREKIDGNGPGTCNPASSPPIEVAWIWTFVLDQVVNVVL